MLSQVQHAKKQWGGSHSAVDNWLAERQQLLLAYYQIAGLNVSDVDTATIERFCEVLMDYISAGHFEIFDILVAGEQQGEAVREQLYPQLLNTTDAALRFNDAFSASQLDRPWATFSPSINSLGETLAERFELEDQLIQHLAAKTQNALRAH